MSEFENKREGNTANTANKANTATQQTQQTHQAHQSHHQAQPRRYLPLTAQHSRGVSGHPRKNLLPKGHHACNSRQQDQAQGNQCAQADVVHQLNVKRRQDPGCHQQCQDKPDHSQARVHDSSSSSCSTCRDRKDNQIRGGMMIENTRLSLNWLAAMCCLGHW